MSGHDNNLLIVQFVTLGKSLQFWLNLRQNREHHFLAQQSNASLLIAFPFHQRHRILRAFGVLQSYDHLFLRNGVQFTELIPLKNGLKGFLQGIRTTLPDRFVDKPMVPKCAGKEWSLAYSMYSGAVFSYHIMQLPILSKFKFMLKLDVDIVFINKMPDIADILATKGCAIAHSALKDVNSCERGVIQALKSWSNSRNESLHLDSEMCSEGRLKRKFYGNFVAFSTEFIRSSILQDLSAYLFHEQSRGYFEYRWGDQGPFAGYACLLTNTNITANLSNRVFCDMQYLRGSFFVHSKKKATKYHDRFPA